MPRWNVDFIIDPDREVSVEIVANTARDAMMEALGNLELDPSEALHTIHAHIGRSF